MHPATNQQCKLENHKPDTQHHSLSLKNMSFIAFVVLGLGFGLVTLAFTDSPSLFLRARS